MKDYGVAAFVAYSACPADILLEFKKSRRQLGDYNMHPTATLYVLISGKVDSPPLLLVHEKSRVPERTCFCEGPNDPRNLSGLTTT